MIYPLLVCLAIDGVWRLVPNPRLRIAGMGLLVFVQLASVAGVRPSYAQYFNGLVGGPEHGYEYVVDSNVDWGQDLPALEKTLAGLTTRSGRPATVRLFYFGKDPPYNRP